MSMLSGRSEELLKNFLDRMAVQLAREESLREIEFKKHIAEIERDIKKQIDERHGPYEGREEYGYNQAEIEENKKLDEMTGKCLKIDGKLVYIISRSRIKGAFVYREPTLKEKKEYWFGKLRGE